MCVNRKITAKADRVLERYSSGELRHKNIWRKGYKVLDVGLRYRLINKGSGWELITHEKYNKEYRR